MSKETKFITCPVCKGEGRNISVKPLDRPCPRCQRAGEIEIDKDATTCNVCNGSGLNNSVLPLYRLCPSCEGDGYKVPSSVIRTRQRQAIDKETHEKAQLVDTVEETDRGASEKKEVKEHRSSRLTYWTVSNSAMILSVLAVAITVFKMTTRPEPKDLQPQIETLNQMSQNVIQLQEFLENQKQELLTRQEVISKLEEERAELEPIVEANRETIAAIFDQYERQQRNKVWLDRAFGFFIGILSSLLAQFGYNWVQRSRYSKSSPSG